MPLPPVNQVNKVNQVPAANGGGTARRRPTPEQIASHIGHLVDFTADYLLFDELNKTAHIYKCQLNARVVAVLKTGIVVHYRKYTGALAEKFVSFRHIHSIRRAGHD